MSKYLVIENNGEAPIEAFTMLGVSSSRGQEDKIGARLIEELG